ncbi:MAG: hypothetical protein PHE43_00130 [Candidatus Nanoarchaeia archaeon]|nr:hypothetical protein [Candidatus Nanoarchaeia archaeon]
MDDSQISKKLQEEGFNATQIYESINQTNIKAGVEDQSYSDAPAPQAYGLRRSQPGMQSSLLDQDIPVPTPPYQEEQSYSQIQPQMDFSMPQQQMPSLNTSNEELIESLIEEKWQQVIQSIGDIEVWKARVKDDLISVKQEIVRVSSRFDSLQSAVLTRVNNYSETLTEVGTDIKALEKVLEKVMEPLTSNIKELNRITEDLKHGYKK